MGCRAAGERWPIGRRRGRTTLRSSVIGTVVAAPRTRRPTVAAVPGKSRAQARRGHDLQLLQAASSQTWRGPLSGTRRRRHQPPKPTFNCRPYPWPDEPPSVAPTEGPHGAPPTGPVGPTSQKCNSHTTCPRAIPQGQLSETRPSQALGRPHVSADVRRSKTDIIGPPNEPRRVVSCLDRRIIRFR